MFIFTFTNLDIPPLKCLSPVPAVSDSAPENHDFEIVAIFMHLPPSRSVRADVSLHTNHMLEIWQSYSIDLKSACTETRISAYACEYSGSFASWAQWCLLNADQLCKKSYKISLKVGSPPTPSVLLDLKHLFRCINV